MPLVPQAIRDATRCAKREGPPDAPSCTPSSPRAIRRPRRASGRTTGSESCGRSKSSPRPAGRSPRSTARARRRRLTSGDMGGALSRPRPRGALRADRRAVSTRCSTRARSTKSQRSAARRLDPALPVMRAHGVPHLIAHLEGRLSLRRGGSAGEARHPPLRQTPVHLGAPSTCRASPGSRLTLRKRRESGRLAADRFVSLTPLRFSLGEARGKFSKCKSGRSGESGRSG